MKTYLVLLISFFTITFNFAQSKILVYHETNGYRHSDAITNGIMMFEDLGNENNDWTTDNSQDSSVFTSANLVQYDAVVFLNTSGSDEPSTSDGYLLTDSEKTALENFIISGKGFVGIHAATDTYRDGVWPFYNELVGGIVQTGPNHTNNNFNADMDVINSHPIIDFLGAVGTIWNKNEEYYYWENNGGQLSTDNTVLLEVGETVGSNGLVNSYDTARPITWYKESVTYDDDNDNATADVTVSGIRSFYTALGHNGSDYNSDTNFRTMLKNATLWAIGGALNNSITYVYDNNVWSPNDPNAVADFDDEIIIMAGDAVISSDTTCDTVSVSPGAALTVNSGITLTANETTLNSTSQLYSSLIVDGVVSGTINYKRYVNANSSGNDLISPPLSGQTWSNFLLSETNATDILDDGNTNPTTYLFGPFDKTVDGYINYSDAITTTLVSGTGYRVGTIGGANLTFTGTIPTSPINTNIAYSGAIFTDWNLIGNPYPSYLDMGVFLNHIIDNSTDPIIRNIDLLESLSGIYGYIGNPNGASSEWSVITLANAGSQLMTPGQGFFVEANSNYVNGYDIVFDLSMRTTGTDDDFIVGRSSNILTYLKLKASTANNAYTTEFYFNENASQGLDHGYDGKFLGSEVPSFSLYSNLVQDNTGIPIALQALNPSDLVNTIIPLGVNANQGEQITFNISETTLPNDIEVYLEDNLTNTITLLNSNNYILIPNVDLSGTGRFYLRISSTALSVIHNELDYLQIYTIAKPKRLMIEGELSAETKVYLYDIQGRLVLNNTINHRNLSNSIDISMIGSGVYIVKVFNQDQTRVKKFVIE